MTQQELRLILVAAGLPAWSWQLPDLTFETCSREFVLANWRAWLDARPKELVVFGDVGGKRVRLRPLWLPGSGDCENLAMGTTAHAQTGNALKAQRTGVPRGGLEYGFLFYTAGPARPDNFNVAGGHSINWFVEPSHKVGFFESGVGQFVDPNPTERSASWFGLAS